MENPKHCLSTAQQPPSRQPPSSRPEPHHSRGPPSHGRNRQARAGGRCWRMRSATLLVAARRAPQASRRGLGRGWGASCCCRHVPPRCSAGRGLTLGKGAVAGCGLRLAAGRTVAQCSAVRKAAGRVSALPSQGRAVGPGLGDGALSARLRCGLSSRPRQRSHCALLAPGGFCPSVPCRVAPCEHSGWCGSFYKGCSSVYKDAQLRASGKRWHAGVTCSTELFVETGVHTAKYP